MCSNAGKHIINNICNEESTTIKSRRKKRCSTSMIGCKATLLTSKAQKRHKWTVIGFNNDHNHGMISLKSVKYLTCHKKMSGIAKNLVEKFDQDGLPTEKVIALFNNQDSTFSNRDCWNHLRDLISKFRCWRCSKFI